MKYTYRPNLKELEKLPPVKIPNEPYITKILQEKSDQVQGKEPKSE